LFSRQFGRASNSCINIWIKSSIFSFLNVLLWPGSAWVFLAWRYGDFLSKIQYILITNHIFKNYNNILFTQKSTNHLPFKHSRAAAVPLFLSLLQAKLILQTCVGSSVRAILDHFTFGPISCKHLQKKYTNTEHINICWQFSSQSILQHHIQWISFKMQKKLRMTSYAV